MKVACHYDPGNVRSTHIAQAMAAGVRACGHAVTLVPGFKDGPAGDVGVAYGWAHPKLYEQYRRAGGHFAYVDLGWWDRKPPTAVLDGFHKVVVDAREPTAYFRANLPGDRFARQGLTVAPWRAGGKHVLLAGMSAKSAHTRGFLPQQWEFATVEMLRRITDRPIIYRPKPSWVGASPIAGTIFSPAAQPLDAVLRRAWAVVTLHSNVAVDGLLAGVPVNVTDGVAAAFSTPLTSIETPLLPEGRERLMADIAYCQWSVPEMASGACWRHLCERTPLCG